MPATFESFGIRFLYPDNWSIAQRSADESDEGLTLELPSGGFVSIEIEDEGCSEQDVIDRVAQAIREEYNEIEIEEMNLADSSEDERCVDMRFYYLDLLIVSRLVLLQAKADLLIIQFQAESRDFDANEPVFNAILKQIRPQSIEDSH